MEKIKLADDFYSLAPEYRTKVRLQDMVEQELSKAREEGFTKEELETILYWSEIVEQYNYNLPKEERKLLKKIKSKLTTK